MYRARGTVEIGFDAAPGSLSPAWTNSGFTWTSVDCLEYSVVRGGGEFDGLAPGAGSVTLDNTDGRYDPSNSGSTYFGSMVSGKPIRIREQINLLPLSLSTGDDVSTLTAIGTSGLGAVTAAARSATKSVEIVVGASGTVGFTTPTGTSGIPVFEYEPITAAVWMKRTTATSRTCTVSVRFYTAGGATVSTVSGAGVGSTTSFQQVSVQTTVPATAAFCALRFEIAGSVAGDLHYVDDLHLVPSTSSGSLTWYPGGPIDVFRGVIDAWRPHQSRPSYSTTELAVSGTFSTITAAPFGESLWATFVEHSKPDLWWRLGEGTEADTVVDSSGNEMHGRYRRDVGSTPVTFTDGLIEEDGDGAVNFDSTYKQHVEGPAITWTSGTFTVAFWVKAFPAATSCTLFDSSRLTIVMNSDGTVTATYLGLSSTSVGRDLRDNQPHLVYVLCGAAGSVSVGLDADASTTIAGALGAERTMLRLYVGRDQAGTAGQYASITIDEVLLWQGVQLSQTWLYITGRAGRRRPGDGVLWLQPSDVAQFVIDLFGSPRPLGSTAAPAGTTPMIIDGVPMSAPIDMLNTCVTSGQLVIREAPDGTPTVSRAKYKPTVANAFLSAVTIGQGAGEYPYSGDPTVDYEETVINHVTISRPAAATVTFRNATSIAARGVRATSITLWSTVDRCARDLAAWILNQYSVEGRRLTGVSPDCVRPDTAQAMLLVEIGDVVTVKDQTADGRTITSVVRIVGKTVSRRRNSAGLPLLYIDLNLSPVRIQPKVLDSTTYGVLGSGANTGKLGP